MPFKKRSARGFVLRAATLTDPDLDVSRAKTRVTLTLMLNRSLVRAFKVKAKGQEVKWQNLRRKALKDSLKGGETSGNPAVRGPSGSKKGAPKKVFRTLARRIPMVSFSRLLSNRLYELLDANFTFVG
jgi:hypothetical protein